MALHCLLKFWFLLRRFGTSTPFVTLFISLRSSPSNHTVFEISQTLPHNILIFSFTNLEWEVTVNISFFGMRISATIIISIILITWLLHAQRYLIKLFYFIAIIIYLYSYIWILEYKNTSILMSYLFLDWKNLADYSCTQITKLLQVNNRNLKILAA